MAMQQLVAVILTYNEAHHIAACDIASSLGLGGRCRGVGLGSTDDTQVRARGPWGRVAVEPAVRPLRRGPLGRSTPSTLPGSDLLTPMNAPRLRSRPKLRQAIDAPGGGGRSRAPRRNFIVGDEMRGGGFTPDYQLRLLRRDAARYIADRQVHEIAELGLART